MGGSLRLRKLTWKEVLEIRRRAKSEEEMTTLVIWKALNAADPSVTPDQVEKLPSDIVTEIINALFPQHQQSATLFTSAQKLKP